MAKRDHSTNKLAAVGLKKLKDGFHADGGNLYLYVRGNSRTWVFNYTSPITGTRKKMGLGSLDSIGLAEARSIASTLRSQVKHPINPIDPILSRNEVRDQGRLADQRRITFKEACKQFIQSKRAEWTNAKHAAQWVSTLKTYAEPKLGAHSVSAIDTAMVLKVLNQEIKNKDGELEGTLWAARTDTAVRLRDRIEAVLNWAKASGYRDGENPAAWKGLLENLLPNPNKTKKRKHFDSIPYSEVGDFMRILRARDGIAPKALEFLIMTAVRSGSLRLATWDQIDFDECVWTIPAENTKGKKNSHRVPLTKQAITLLKALPRLEKSNYVFPSPRGGALSDMALNKVMRDMRTNGELLLDGVPHGFRSTFRVWAAEQTSFPDDIRKAASMHAVGDAVKEAYERTTFFDKRRELMTQWTNFLDKSSVKRSSKIQNNVLPIKEVA